MAENGAERIIITSSVLTDTTPFNKSDKFRRTGCNKLSCLAKNDTQDNITYFRNELELIKSDVFIRANHDQKIILTPSILAAGITLEDTNISITSPEMLRVPVILIPIENCTIDFIEFEFIEETTRLSAKCKNGNNGSCSIKNDFCNRLVDQNTAIYAKAKEIAVAIQQATNEPTGYIPFVKYSTFLEYLIWMSNLRQHIETRYNKALMILNP